jgi:hypothetical protein
LLFKDRPSLEHSHDRSDNNPDLHLADHSHCGPSPWVLENVKSQ